MKKYTIKEVIKKENQLEVLRDKSSAEGCALLGSLSTFCFGTAAILYSYITKDSSALTNSIAIATSAGFSLGGIALFADMMTAQFRKGKLEDKLGEIYEQSGIDKDEVLGEMHAQMR